MARRRTPQQFQSEEVVIDKLVHGGQGIGTMADGRKVFVWNALPGERVKVQIIKSKRSYAEGIADEIIEPSSERIAPREDNYLATSPWQILSLESENKYKRAIVDELFRHEKVTLPDFKLISEPPEWNYRNKMEYGFWGDDSGLHLAGYRRGSHNKQIVEGSVLARPAVDLAARAVLNKLKNVSGIRAADLKTLIVRVNRQDEAVASLFVKSRDFPHFEMPSGLKGIRVYYSNPKSPASVSTELLQETGTVLLQDELLDKSFIYDVNSFFQVNLPMFEKALVRIASFVSEPEIVDMYAGVGGIGLSVAQTAVDLVELDPAAAAMARLNASESSLDTRVIEASAERSLDYIVSGKPVIFDPPRAGLHDRVVQRVLGVLPPKIIYLSCNPATQARDLAKLQVAYDITFFEVYNFFPHTPHIETLAVLNRK